MSQKPHAALKSFMMRYAIPIQVDKHKEVKMILCSENKEDEEDEVPESNLYDELLEDLSNIKSRRSLEFFVCENKSYINQLDPNDKSTFLGIIQKRFFAGV